jgi:hypothetical protein
MKFHRQAVIVLVAAVVSASAFAQELKAESDPGKLGFDADRLKRVTQAFQGYVDSGQIPGAVVLIARNDKVAYFLRVSGPGAEDRHDYRFDLSNCLYDQTDRQCRSHDAGRGGQTRYKRARVQLSSGI